jgi:potassium efflux system protein
MKIESYSRMNARQFRKDLATEVIRMIRLHGSQRTANWALLIVLCFGAWWGGVVYGQTPVDLIVKKAASTESTVANQFWPTREDIHRRLERNESELSRADVQLRATESSQSTAWLTESINTQIAQRQFLKTVYQQHLSLLETIASSGIAKDELERELESFNDRQIAVSEMLSFGEVERLRAVFDNENNRIATIDAEIESIKGMKEGARTRLKVFERTLRQATEDSEGESESVEATKQKRKRDTLSLSIEISKSSIGKMVLEIQILTDQLLVHRNRLDQLSKILEATPQKTVISESDLEQQIAQLAEREEKIRVELITIQSLLTELQDKFNETLQHEGLDSKARLQIFSIHELLQENYRLRASYLNASMSEIYVLQYLWRVRFEISSDLLSDELVEDAVARIKQLENRLSNAKSLVELHLDQVRGLSSAPRLALRSDPETMQLLAGWRALSGVAVSDFFKAGNQRLLQIEIAEQLAQRVSEELGREGLTAAQNWSWGLVSTTVKQWWDIEVFSVDDRSITAGKILSGFLMLFIGLFISRHTSHVIGPRLLRRCGVHEGGMPAFQTIFFYLLCVGFCFLTLEWLNIPFTVFAFLGGAAAIAIGFGSQTLLNNFISGLIILGERPVRVGDLIEIDDIRGNITHIGARSTKLLTGENLEIIVPNSKFMEQRLINWTLSSNEIRTVIKIGVAYGSPTNKVISLLQMALEECPAVNAKPEPIVLFADFGADALQFELHFWIHMQRLMEGKKAESDVRRKIDEVLRANDICVAFPQRDIHLDVKDPIQVSLAEFQSPRVTVDAHPGAGGVRRTG